MFRTLTIAVASGAALLLSPIAFAQQTGGTADEAKAMLMKAVAAVKAGKAKALDMLPRTPLFTLLATSLLAAPSFEPPQLPALSSASEETQSTASFGSLRNSNDERYTLRGTVVNPLTGEPIRGALVQIYFLGQTSMLTGPDGKFQFDGLPAGQSTITVRKPGLQK